MKLGGKHFRRREGELKRAIGEFIYDHISSYAYMILKMGEKLDKSK